MSFSLNNLLELDALVLVQVSTYQQKRFIFEKIALSLQDRVFKGIVGPRGAGKTVLLKQLRAQEKHALYIACDVLDSNDDLFDILKTCKEKPGIHCFFLDEIHFLKTYDQMLKKVYDFLDVQVIFTSSVALSLVQSSYDLSRRSRLYTMYPFSFREYLNFAKNIHLSSLKLSDLLSGAYDQDYLRYEYLFEGYLQGGLYPFCLNATDPLPLFENILDKIIEKDVAVTADLAPSDQAILKKLVRFVASSAVDGINVTSIAKNLSITKYKSEQYVALLEKAFILQIIHPKGSNVLREPKILMHLPYRLLFKSYQEAIGAMREDFFVESMRMMNQELYYLKSKRGEKTPDYWLQIDDKAVVIEVGGSGKGRSQFKGITEAKTLILADKSSPGQNRQPLFLLGFVS